MIYERPARRFKDQQCTAHLYGLSATVKYRSLSVAGTKLVLSRIYCGRDKYAFVHRVRPIEYRIMHVPRLQVVSRTQSLQYRSSASSTVSKSAFAFDFTKAFRMQTEDSRDPCNSHSNRGLCAPPIYPFHKSRSRTSTGHLSRQTDVRTMSTLIDSFLKTHSFPEPLQVGRPSVVRPSTVRQLPQVCPSKSRIG